MVADEEGREFSRVKPHIAVSLQIDTKRIDGVIRDLSMNGLYVSCERVSAAAGTSCDVTVHLDGGIEIRLTGSIVRVESGGVAITTETVSLDSFEHLRRLVLYNSMRPAQLEDEMQKHVGLKRPE